MLNYNHHSHCKYSIKMHFVFCTKYRRNILHGQFAEDIKDLIVLHTATRGYAIDTIEVDGDHLHVLVDIPPTASALDFVRIAKMMSTYHIWRSKWAAKMRKTYWRERTLWSDGYFVASTGQASTDTIRKYIEEQG